MNEGGYIHLKCSANLTIPVRTAQKGISHMRETKWLEFNRFNVT